MNLIDRGLFIIKVMGLLKYIIDIQHSLSLIIKMLMDAHIILKIVD